MGITPSPSQMVVPLKLSSTSRPIRQSASMKMKAAARADLAARQRPRSRARNLRVDVAVDQVVIGAAGAAHGDGADSEQSSSQGSG